VQSKTAKEILQDNRAMTFAEQKNQPKQTHEEGEHGLDSSFDT
jgi:hypothetical protein